MDNAQAAEEVMARRSNSVVNVLQAYRALQLLLECFDIRLHLRVKSLFISGINDYGGVRWQSMERNGGVKLGERMIRRILESVG